MITSPPTEQGGIFGNQASQNRRQPDCSLAKRSLAPDLIRHDAAAFFANNCEEIYQTWVSLLRRTTLRHDRTSKHRSVADAFMALDGIINQKDGSNLLSRLAHIQLSRTWASLCEMVDADRRHGRIRGKAGRKSVSMAADIDRTIQAQRSDGRLASTRLRRSRRWALLAGVSPLLLVTCSDAAEIIM